MLYKVLAKGAYSCHGGSYRWSVPKNDKPGEWTPKAEGKLVPCENGYHLCRKQDLVHWLDETIYEAEHKGQKITDGNKVVVQQARLIRKLDTWNERTARLFACDCAERVLHIYEKQYPNDSRARTAIEVARLYADGKATLQDLNDAASAAYSAADSAADSAAYSAADSAAYSAADSAYSAAYSAARKWQTERLFHYLRGEIG